MKLKFAEVHSPLFHGGKNHGVKLLPKDGLEIEYDREEKELTVWYKGEPTYLPSTSVHNYTPLERPVPMELKDVFKEPTKLQMTEHGNKLDPGVTNKSHAQDTRKIKSAQVSGPHDHVFQGEGSGRKRDK